MPQALLLPVAGVLFNIGAPLAIVNTVAGVGLAGSLFSAAVGFGLSAAASYLSSTLLGGGRRPDLPKLPTPEDGKYNLKQNVPSLVFAYGRVKKGGDYVFLEEKGGTAYHVLVHAAHEIQGYVSHYLDDSVATLNGSGYVTSVNSADEGADKYYKIGSSYKVRIQTRTGAASNTAYSTLTSQFSSIWTSDHRGDGLASVLMSVDSVSANDYTTVFPSGMPSHNAIFDGKKLYDPRTETTAFSKNLGLIKLDHLLAPYGGKQSLADINTESFEAFAAVCDEDVINRDAGTEKRYHGGFWARYENDPVEVGREIDEAADAVLYEDANGKIAVHPGKWVEPDIHIQKKDISSFEYLANRNKAESVIAVRGRFTDPEQDFNTIDAAIYGDPYVSDDDERTRTVDNVCVQSHNHMARLQKLRYLRSRAPRVFISCDFWAAENLPFRRFVKVTKPPQLVSAYVEILGKPKLILYPELKYEFEGIVVPSTLYDFDAATEEGEPGGVPTKIGAGGIPDVNNFAVNINAGPYALATFDSESDLLIYELEFQATSGGAVYNLSAQSGVEELQTSTLVDGVEYKFRMRARDTAASYGDWTNYITLTATADPTAPDAPTSVDASSGSAQATITWDNPNSANFEALKIYRNTVDSFGSATLVATIYTGVETYDDTGLSADDYYYWVTAANGSGIESSQVSAASNPVTVT
ncbi:hypothetical protein [uncultured Roseibium sp.]|uniref:hypothetical protein n=1 Tax=uncultured Roseibium sp. TaxID=1936171 RepID=UPI002611D0E1|nr:hypothetical protein [uncultured Roseibium sp.]